MIARFPRPLWLSAILFCALAPAPGANLTSAFQNPPVSARPWTYLMIMDGNLTREGLTADLEAMQRAGIGGVIVMEVDAGIPRGPVKFMSPEWRQLFAHLVHEAERLGLQVTLNAGPGWTGSGGPWVKPEQSMQHLVASALDVTGPKELNAALPLPKRRPAFFGDGALPPDLEKAKNEFYREVCVLAFPKPAGNEIIADIDQKALYVRAPYSSSPGVPAFLPSLAEYPGIPPGSTIDRSRLLDLSSKLSHDGRLSWSVPPGEWIILRFGRTSTGANTRPAPEPGLGLECDKFDSAALDAHFEQFVTPLLHDLGPRKSNAGWTSLHIDSWEMGAQNWTAAFRDEFRQRRGYDPLPWLPAMTGRVVDSLEKSERFLWDLRQTAQELVVQNHATHLRNLGRKHGLALSIEPYDMNPCADMTLGAVADVPMCEFWLQGFDTTFSVLESASVAHTLGRPIVAAEAFTSAASERWQAFPATMKPLGDWAFAAGVNRIVFHRYQHQPWLDIVPGMTMGPYGVHWERTQTFWDLLPDYHQYLARCQFLLRQGIPVADVCLLVAEGAPHVFRPPAGAIRGIPPDRTGYNFDACAPDTLIERMSVKDGRLQLPHGLSYALLVLPERQTMTPRLLNKIRDLVAAGATVIGPPPLKSPSLENYPDCDARIQSLAAELWADKTTHQFGKGRVFTSIALARDPSASPALAGAEWIWHPEGSPAVSAPVATRRFRRFLVIESHTDLKSATVDATGDNSFEFFVNDASVLQGDNFNETYSASITRYLRAGTNVLAVAVANGGDAPNPAGLIAALRLEFKHGKAQTIKTDASWWSSASAPATHAESSLDGWVPVQVLGKFDMSPWNRRRNTQQPQQYGDFSQVVDILRSLNLPPDFSSEPPLRYAHRQADGADIYFLANPDATTVDASCAFRVTAKQPELWDPVSGSTQRAPTWSTSGSLTRLNLRLAPNQSLFVVFRKSGRPNQLWSVSANQRSEPRSIELAGPWHVTFEPMSKSGKSRSVTFTELTDWTNHADPAVKYFSGTATYLKTFDVDPALLKGSPSHAVWLELGTVKNLAAVELNGKKLGTVWCDPWHVDVSKALRPGGNQLAIRVANLWPNRLIGDELLPADAEYHGGGNLVRFPAWLTNQVVDRPSGRATFATWKYYTKDSALLPSGLLGPVKLQFQR